MIAEEFQLIGILDENLVKGFLRSDELRLLLVDYLQIPRYHPIMLDVLERFGVSRLDKKVDIQIIFKALEKSDFVQNIPDFYNNRMSKWTIRLVKAAIVAYVRNKLSFMEIREAANIHHLKEAEFFTIGVVFDINTIYSMLWAINKTINLPVLNKWISLVQDIVEVKGVLMPHEFLYLVCNCHNKSEMFEKIPKVNMFARMNPKTKLFHIDDEFLKTQVHIKSSDARVQHMLNAMYSPEKAIHEGKVIMKNSKDKNSNKKRTSAATHSSLPNEHSEYHKLLKSSDLAIEIKQRLRGASTTINLSKNASVVAKKQQLQYRRLNGEDILEEIEKQGYEDLTKTQNSRKASPDDNQSEFSRIDAVRYNPIYITAPKIRPKSSLPPKQLDELRDQLGMRSPTSQSVVIHNTASPNALHTRQSTNQMNEMFSQTTSPERLFLAGSQSKKSVRTADLFGRGKMMKNDSKISSTYEKSTAHDLAETFSHLENLLDQEFEIYEERNKKEDSINISKRPPSAYFNSGNTQRKYVKIFSASSKASRMTSN